MTWLQITITALRQHDGQTELRVEAEDIEIGRAEVPEQESTNWQNVKVYAASPWHDRNDLNLSQCKYRFKNHFQNTDERHITGKYFRQI